MTANRLEEIMERHERASHTSLSVAESHQDRGYLLSELARVTAERDEEKANTAEWKRMALALTTILKAKCSDEEWKLMNATFESKLSALAAASRPSQEWPLCDYTHRPCLAAEQICRCQRCREWASHIRKLYAPLEIPQKPSPGTEAQEGKN